MHFLQSFEVSAIWLSAQVSPIIINTVITIQSALTPTAETPEELDSPVPVDLWERRGWKELKFWFLEEEGDEDTASLAPLIPQGESLQVFSCIMTQLIILYNWLLIICCNIVTFISQSLDLFWSGILFDKQNKQYSTNAQEQVVSFHWLSIPAGDHQINLSDSGGWSGTPHCPHASGKVLLPWRCRKLVHTH